MKAPDQKSVTIGNQSSDALWATVADGFREDIPPLGSMNARQFAEKFKLPLGAVRQRLSSAANSGEMIAMPCRVIAGGKIRTVIFYTPKAAPKRSK